MVFVKVDFRRIGSGVKFVEHVLRVVPATGRSRARGRRVLGGRPVVGCGVHVGGADPVQPQRGQRVNVDEHGEKEQEAAHRGASGTGGGGGDDTKGSRSPGMTAREYPVADGPRRGDALRRDDRAAVAAVARRFERRGGTRPIEAAEIPGVKRGGGGGGKIEENDHPPPGSIPV